ncbi:MAG: ChrR family anti-sigma-E factor [Pseudohongiellaceae bacterium]
MNTEVKLHPSTELLNQFVQGELGTGNSVVVSAHMELCSSCSEKAKKLQALAVSTWVDPSLAQPEEPGSETDYAKMVATIVESPQINTESNSELVEVDIAVLNKPISLPRVLAKAIAQGLIWKQLPGGISEAQVRLDDETQCEFIYMAPGSRVPVHTHTGSETTLVLDGSFQDELGNYAVSDFIVRDKRHNHQPSCENGCLCFAVLDSPLKFTRGLARFMNPLNRFRFKRALSRLA